MPTLNELAKQYAGRIQDAARPVRKASTSLEESRDQREDLSAVVRTLLAEIDGLAYEGGAPIDETTRNNLFGALERELGIERGQIRQLKEASIQSTLAYERLISMLLAQLRR